jgi:hypothetical protein
MSKIVIGKSGARNVTLDVDALLRTRLLVQANSGKGKSWLLRRLAEQLFGKVQVLIVDPEGEFATLREKFGYVLVGKGGETPADPRSAALVAHKLLELRASAVCDLYEMKPATRHEWLQKFLDALIDSPKNLWHPCVVIVDEAHVFCPEKGAGESVASEAMIGLGTRGRKRGFAIVPATQRLGKLRKDLAAELLNVMIGGTFIDIDRKRAADALGIYGKDQQHFFDDIKLMKSGMFFALGPAISNERILVKVGPVETTHPEAGSAKHAADAPPAPDKVKAMLPKLADLPKTAEEKARTEAEMRKEIRELKAQLRSAPVQKVQPGAAARPIIDSRLIARAVHEHDAKWRKWFKDLDRAMLPAFQQIQKMLDAAAEKLRTAPALPISGGEIKNMPGVVREGARSLPASVAGSTPAPRSIPPREQPQLNGDGELTPYQKEILNSLADLEAIGRTEPSWPLVGAAAGKSSGSSTFERYAARLRTMRLVDYPKSGQMRITDEGRKYAAISSQPISSEDIQSRALKIITPYQANLLRTLIAAHPHAITWQELSERSGKAHESSTFERYMAALRSMEMIEYTASKTAKAADWLFLE